MKLLLAQVALLRVQSCTQPGQATPACQGGFLAGEGRAGQVFQARTCPSSRVLQSEKPLGRWRLAELCSGDRAV